MSDKRIAAADGVDGPSWAEIRDALICWYDVRNDPCDKHLGEEGFARCKACRMRDRIDSLTRRGSR